MMDFLAGRVRGRSQDWHAGSIAGFSWLSLFTAITASEQLGESTPWVEQLGGEGMPLKKELLFAWRMCFVA